MILSTAPAGYVERAKSTSTELKVPEPAFPFSPLSLVIGIKHAEGGVARVADFLLVEHRLDEERELSGEQPSILLKRARFGERTVIV